MDLLAIVCRSGSNGSLVGTIGCNNSDLTSLARLDAARRSLWYESSLLLNDSLQHDIDFIHLVKYQLGLSWLVQSLKQVVLLFLK
jgi:hypothetical protein